MSKTIYKAFQFRIYPTKEQERFLARHFGACRFIFNHFLEYRNNLYQTTKKGSTFFKDCKLLTSLKKSDGYGWLYEVGNKSLEASIKNLNAAHQNFFKGHSNHPKFKSRRNEQSFNIQKDQRKKSLRLEENKLFIPKLKSGIKISQHQQIQGKIFSCTIRKKPSGKYFASINCEIEKDPLPISSNQIGVDLGIKSFLTDSNGCSIKSPNIFKLEKKLKHQQRQLSKKKKGSKRREKARIRLAKTHEKIGNIRKNFLHQTSRQIINENQVVAIEDLNVQGMMKNHSLAGSIQKASWGEFVRQLTYKAKWADRELVKVGMFFPSSKICNHCGFKNDNLTLKDREWDCPQCQAHLDRDVNAAINIKNEGLKILSLQKDNAGSGIDSKEKLVEASSKRSKTSKKSGIRKSRNRSQKDQGNEKCNMDLDLEKVQ